MAIKNNSKLAGAEIKGTSETFGAFGRYRVFAVHTRFDAVQWFVKDAECIDELTELPAVIRKADTKAEAMKGLESESEDLGYYCDDMPDVDAAGNCYSDADPGL